MSYITVTDLKARRVAGVFDSKLKPVIFHIPWHWGERDYWWLYAENPEKYAWQIDPSGNLQVQIKDIWTTAHWIGADFGPEWISIMRLDGTMMQIAIANGRVIEKTWSMSNIRYEHSEHGPLRREWDAIAGRVQKITTTGVARLPEFTPEQLEELHALHDERYLAAAEKWSKTTEHVGHYKDVMFQIGEKLKEIGFDPPEHDFRRVPLVVPIYRNEEGAFWITDPEKTHSEHGRCECAKCDHDMEEWKSNDCCSCDNCMDNNNHWYGNGSDPEHCNFCAEYSEHLEKAENDYKE